LGELAGAAGKWFGISEKKLKIVAKGGVFLRQKVYFNEEAQRRGEDSGIAILPAAYR